MPAPAFLPVAHLTPAAVWVAHPSRSPPDLYIIARVEVKNFRLPPSSAPEFNAREAVIEARGRGFVTMDGVVSIWWRA